LLLQEVTEEEAEVESGRVRAYDTLRQG
jgi:hypothetical protein